MSSVNALRLIALGSVALSTLACVPPYKPPMASEPHAVVKYRRVYQFKKGTNLREGLNINNHSLYRGGTNTKLLGQPRIDAVLVHPEVAEFEARAEFYHTEMRQVQESYTVQEPYSAQESYSCGFGDNQRTCYRTVTRYRSETKQRWVTRQVEVSDGSCSRFIAISPEVGGTYLLEFEYQDRQICRLSCFEQSRGSGGKLENKLCRAPSPQAMAKLRD